MAMIGFPHNLLVALTVRRNGGWLKRSENDDVVKKKK